MTQNNAVVLKNTTQKAPLERILTHLRTRKIMPYVRGAIVLDFGCGAYLHTLRTIADSAAARYGIDSLYVGTKSHKTTDGIGVAGSFDDLRDMLKVDDNKLTCILSLACFEHMEMDDCRWVLRQLHDLSDKDATLVGTVPTPPAKPVLEFLSYRLRLIDRTQIEDHKVYYDRDNFKLMLQGTGWELSDYYRFQLGMNSFFKLKKS